MLESLGFWFFASGLSFALLAAPAIKPQHMLVSSLHDQACCLLHQSSITCS